MLNEIFREPNLELNFENFDMKLKGITIYM